MGHKQGERTNERTVEQFRILTFCLVNYVSREIVQTVLKIGPYRQPKFGDARERQYLCIVSSNSSNYAVKLRELCRQTSTKVMLALILSSAGIIDESQLCRQTIRNTETRKIEPKNNETFLQ